VELGFRVGVQRLPSGFWSVRFWVLEAGIDGFGIQHSVFGYLGFGVYACAKGAALFPHGVIELVVCRAPESESECVCESERGRERERESVCVRERERGR
jgi:hypothetical protein